MNKRPAGYILPIFFLLMFIYVLARASALYFTCDEAWSYYEYGNASVWDILTFKPVIANNHVLNSLLMKLSGVFSTSELSLRLPNVLSYILFLYAVSGIAGVYFKEKGIFYYSLILSLCLNIYVSEFFAYARGYGLSLAFLMSGILQLMLAYEREKYRRHIHIALLSFVAGVFANLVLLNVMPAVWILSAYIIYLRQGRRQMFKALAVPFLYGLLLLAVSVYPFYILKVSGELYWGGITNFVSDTLAGIVEDMFALKRHTLPWAIAVAIFLLLLLWELVVLARGLRPEKRRKDLFPVYIAPVILLFCTVFLNLTFYLLDVHLLKHRTAIFFHPICILALFSAVKLISVTRPLLARAVSSSVALIMVLAFITNMNISRSSEWPFNEYDRQVIADVESASGKELPTLFAFHYHAVGIHYYIKKYRSKLIVHPDPTLGEEPEITEDFAYIRADLSKIIPPGYILYKSYGDGQFLLYKKTGM